MANEPILVRCFDSFARVRSDAASRLDDGAQPVPFDRLDWFERLHEHAFAGHTPLILLASRGPATAWLFLTRREDGVLAGIANWYSFVFRPQFHDAESREERIALLTAIALELRGKAPRLSLHPVIDDAQLDTALIAEAFQRARWHVIPRVMAMKRVLHLAPGTTFEDYWAARPGQLRSTLKRKTQRHPLNIAIHYHIDDARWTALESVFGASWKPAGDDFRFLRAFAEAEASDGRLRLGIAYAGEESVAAEFWTIENGTAYIHKLAFDERFADASPGTQLSYAMFRHAIDEDGASTIDFGTGDNDYKALWMPCAVPMRQIDMFDLRQPASWRIALATTFSALSQPDTRRAEQRRSRRRAINRAKA